ncbi:MAG: prolipoprotein diacylglyceryl transferase [Clostridiales bacterium]|nr:prolipoprotein diacylglyceryl transferase [Clostridiales bacterium]
MGMNLYGLFIALGVLAAVLYMGREAVRRSLPRDLALDMALWAVPLAVVGSRLYYVAFTWERYRGDLLSILRVWEGGLAIYGGILGGALGVYLLARRRRLPFLTLADLVAPALLLGQAIGRWGNFFNQEAYGLLVDSPVFQRFPFAVQVNGQWHLATFLYESLWNLLGFAVLLRLRAASERRGPGTLFLCYLLWYGLGRLVIEGLRLDSLMLGSLRVSQLLSALLITLAGLALLLRLRRAWFHGLPLLLGLGLLLLSALGQGWALVPGYVSLAVFVAGLYPSLAREEAA